ncbi:tRNA (N(6)-L-threonylcarbamoyladenosine(37)-C(2))-methylthiotransferase MtaB [bacterium]|nr:tRNA (N(6)-L-threonylcarbamoyladenosine(37)-C(2))-methylthiotransferase MtaB [bacterium]
MTNFYIKSLGCKQNALEGQIIKNDLIDAGLIEVFDIKNADIFILNSCTVTSHSDSQVNYLLSHAKKQNPKIKNILTGCCAQTGNYKIENVDVVVGNSEKSNILDFIQKNGIFVQDIFKQEKFQNKFLTNCFTTRMNIKIQDGCNNRCSYCIIPYARGKSRSNSIENIIKQIQIAHDTGIKEIVLTGIHIGQWGLEWDKTLLDLLKEIEKTKIHRYRLGSLYVNEITDEMIDFLKKSEKFCPHFHLSLQSLCDKTLKNMNRFYTKLDALLLIEKLHKNFTLPFLGCDIIVGFPYEDENDFQETYNNLKGAKLSYIHCFPYSPRKGTPAYDLPQIQDIIKSQRAKKLQDLSKQLHKNFLDLNKNTTAEILVQKKSDKNNLYSAITKNYIKIFLDDKRNDLRGTLKTVDLSEFDLF